MKASELRYGNLFYPIDRSSKVHLPMNIAFSVLEIRLFKVMSHKADENPAQVEPVFWGLEDVSPIPLTEEWLKKLGFTWAEGLRMNVIKDGITVCEPDDYEDSVYHSIYFYHNGECFGFEVSNEWGENGNVMLPKVKYVHQLQNLYFALTGEELALKEED